MTEINLAQLTRNGEVRNLAGHERGQAARALFELDRLDKSAEPIVVVVPEDVYLLSPSFIQGMFSESIKSLGDRSAFLGRYSFRATPSVLRQIDSGIASSLMRRHSVLAAG